MPTSPSDMPHLLPGVGRVICKSHKVRFARDIQQVFSVLSLSDYTDFELKECFYTSDDRYRIQSERKHIITRVEREEETVGKRYPNKKQKRPSCFRGLEFLTEEGSHQSQQRVWSVIDTVINEQENQWDRKVVDSDRIAQLSQSVSIESTLLALRSAIVDQEAAFKVYRNWAVDNPVVFAATTA